jgi:hypothetical protein
MVHYIKVTGVKPVTFEQGSKTLTLREAQDLLFCCVMAEDRLVVEMNATNWAKARTCLERALKVDKDANYSCRLGVKRVPSLPDILP